MFSNKNIAPFTVNTFHSPIKVNSSNPQLRAVAHCLHVKRSRNSVCFNQLSGEVGFELYLHKLKVNRFVACLLGGFCLF